MRPAEAGPPEEENDFREPYRRDLDFCPTCMKHLEECECGMTDSGALPPAELDAIRQRWELVWESVRLQATGSLVFDADEITLASEDIRALLASDAHLRAENGRLREALTRLGQKLCYCENCQIGLPCALAGEGHPKEGNDGDS